VDHASGGPTNRRRVVPHFDQHPHQIIRVHRIRRCLSYVHGLPVFNIHFKSIYPDLYVQRFTYPKWPVSSRRLDSDALDRLAAVLKRGFIKKVCQQKSVNPIFRLLSSWWNISMVLWTSWAVLPQLPRMGKLLIWVITHTTGCGRDIS